MSEAPPKVTPEQKIPISKKEVAPAPPPPPPPKGTLLPRVILENNCL